MSWFSNIFSGSVTSVIDSVSNAIDKFVTTDKEKLELHNELAKIELEHMLKASELELKFEEEISKRHQSDMISDNWLSKSIRPLTLIFILVMYSLLSISSGFEFEVTEAYVKLLGEWGMLIMSFYFGGRTVEKVSQIVKGSNNVQIQ